MTEEMSCILQVWVLVVVLEKRKKSTLETATYLTTLFPNTIIIRP